MHTISEKRIRMLNPRDIKKPSFSVRTLINEEELSLLRDSISACGVLQPLLVRPLNRGKYELISGNRRLQAAILAGLRRVPCVVHNVNDCEALLYSIAENIQSQKISVFDEAKAVDRLTKQRGMSLSEAAVRLGVTQSAILSKLQILRLEDRIAHRISAAGLTESHAKALLRIPKEGRAQVLDTVISRGLTGKQTEEYIFSILNPPLAVEEQEIKPIKKTVIGDTRLFGNSLNKMVETLKSSGFKVNYRKSESEGYTEYKIRIKKEPQEEAPTLQLKAL